MSSFDEGNAILSKAKDHFKKRLVGELKPIKVPEWDTTIYCPQSVALIRLKRIQTAVAEGNIDACVQVLVETARNAEGKPLFQQTMKDSIMKETDPAVVLRLATELSSALMPSGSEDIEGNLPGTPSLDNGTG